ncbi:LacI family DNA-binding transcriptional regulator [Kitasatospora purpeofusca]|uniref:LacI family DNA-binding transcriptional regulator n=1 Tax=Kitasatospora purpeofusca TaxID=67352 RepID=UPI0030F08DE9
MNAAQRQDAILRRLRRSGSVRVAELAEQLGVSPITVRRDIVAMEQHGLLVRVHGGAMLRRPPKAERPARRRAAASAPARTRTIGMLVPSTRYYFHELVLGAQAYADAHRARLVLAVSGDAPDDHGGPGGRDDRDDRDDRDAERDLREVRRLVALGVEGLLLTTATTPVPLWLNDLKVPFVLVERRQPLELDPVDFVASDHEYGAFLAFRHLAARGHRRIAVFSDSTPTSPWIHRGYDAARRMFDLDPGMPRVDRPYSVKALEEFLDAALAAGATAILAHSDDKAVLLLQWLAARGLSVPDDVALVSYDDEVAAFADVPITAVAPPRRVIGHTAAQRLLTVLAAERRPTLGHVQLLPTLHIRDSTRSR